MICGIFLSSFLLRSLGDTEYGIYQTIASFASYLVLLEFGTGTVMTRNIATCIGKKSDKKALDKNISTIWTITHILTIVIVIFSVGFYLFIGPIYSNSMTPEQIDYARYIFILVSANLILSFYLQTINGVVLGFEKYSFISIQNIIKILLRTAILTIFILIYRYSIIIAVTDTLLSAAIIIFSVLYCKKKVNVKFGFFQFDKTIFKAAMPLCLAIFLQTIVNQANNNVDKFIIGIKMSPEAVTLYSVALYIFSIFSSLTTIPISMYSPQISIDMSRNISNRELSEKLISPCRLTVFIGGSILFGFISAGRQFIDILYGKSYEKAWIIALILMIPSFINMVNGVLINVLNYLNKRMVRSLALMITTAANIILTVLWIDKWGMIGAAAATCVCTILGQIIIMNIYYAKYLKIRVLYMFKHAFKGILPFQILGAAAGLIIGYFIDNTIVSFIVCGGIYLTIFGIGYIIFGATEKEKTKIKSLINRSK